LTTLRRYANMADEEPIVLPPPDDTRDVTVALAGDPILGWCTVHGGWGDDVERRPDLGVHICRACRVKTGTSHSHPLNI
jgi:hypothetical protein